MFIFNKSPSVFRLNSYLFVTTNYLLPLLNATRTLGEGIWSSSSRFTTVVSTT